jgi:hypothetical protein
MEKADAERRGRDLERVRAVIADLRGGQPITKFAQEIRVAPATLRTLLNEPPGKLSAQFQEMVAKTRVKAITGRAESLGRIYGFLVRKERPWEGNENDFVALFGLDAQNAYVEQGLQRWRESAKPADTFLTQDDITLDRIVAGDGADRSAKTVRAGILVWPPYCSDKNDLGGSFAGRMMRRLLGSLRPDKSWKAPELVPLQFHQILTPEILKTGHVDAVFCLYDLPSRRMAGFEFIHLPGLAGQQAAMAISDPQDQIALTWDLLLDPERNNGLLVYVVSDDAAERLVSGPCAYPPERVRPIKAEGAIVELNESIAQTLVEAARNYVAAREEFRRNPVVAPPASIAFVGDAAMVQDVLNKFRARVRADEPRLAQMVSIVSEDNKRCPKYPIGIAVSANSKRWREILHDTLVRELFETTVSLTARAYAELLAEPSSIRLVPLGDEISSSARDCFIEDVLKELERLEAAVKGQGLPKLQEEARISRFGSIREEIERTWSPPAAPEANYSKVKQEGQRNEP